MYMKRLDLSFIRTVFSVPALGLVLALLMCPSHAAAQSTSSVCIGSSYLGSAYVPPLSGGELFYYSQYVDGSVVYLGESEQFKDYSSIERLLVIDVSDMNNPVVLSRLEHSDQIRDIVVRDGVAYLANGASGLLILDVSDPSDPVQIASYDTGDFANRIVLQGDFAVVAQSQSLQVIDVEIPATPELASSIATTGYPYDMVVENSVVYIASDLVGLQIFGMSNPSNITFLGSYNTQRSARGISVSDSIAYVADYRLTSGSTVLAFDVSDPTSPTQLSFYIAPESNISDVVAIGSTVYVNNGSSGIRVVDYTDPAAPAELGIYGRHTSNTVMTVKGTTMYVTNEDQGLSMIDVSMPGIPDVTQLQGLGRVYDIQMRGTDAFILESGRLIVTDLADPSTPVTLSNTTVYDDYDSSGAIVLDGDIAYIATAAEGVLALDISDPANPAVIGSLPSGAYGQAIAVENDVAYVANGFDGIQIVDITDPSSPNELATFDLPFNQLFAIDVAIQNSVLYVANRQVSDQLMVFDVSNPASPTLMNSLLVSSASGVAVAGSTLCLNATDGLRLFDISNPFAPVLVGEYELIHTPSFVEMDGDIAYAGNLWEKFNQDRGFIGTHVLDISDPASPKLLALLEQGVNIDVSGETAYIAADYRDVFIYDVSTDCAGPCPQDINKDGELDFFDVSAFVAAFAANDPVADFTGDGEFNFFDISAFVAAFSAGCP